VVRDPSWMGTFVLVFLLVLSGSQISSRLAGSRRGALLMSSSVYSQYVKSEDVVLSMACSFVLSTSMHALTLNQFDNEFVSVQTSLIRCAPVHFLCI
jgi:ABC-type spermidine/putrescine transport system permease subunit I